MKTKLIGIIICMLLVGTVLPVSGTLVIGKTTSFNTSGNTLYVGGSGEGNYSSIQDAIDDANPGDTVFVYDDSSPYFGKLAIYKSINLIGENKNTTTIRHPITITADNVFVKGLTVELVSSDKECSKFNIFIEEDSDSLLAGVIIDNSFFNTITGNVIKNFSISLKNSNNNIVTDNIISKSLVGIDMKDSASNTLSHNEISKCRYKAIQLYGLSYDKGNIISENNIRNNEVGIYLFGSDNNDISNNEFVNNTKFGIEMYYSYNNNIYCNNFIDNIEDAYFCYHIRDIGLFYKIIGGTLLSKWIYNYWGEPYRFPHKINGILHWHGYFELFDKYVEINLPWVNFDWLPAKEPYDI